MGSFVNASELGCTKGRWQIMPADKGSMTPCTTLAVNFNENENPIVLMMKLNEQYEVAEKIKGNETIKYMDN